MPTLTRPLLLSTQLGLTIIYSSHGSPQENLYPILDDLLEDWQAAFPRQFEGIRVLGNRWSPASHNIKDFLARNHVPYQWLDIETAQIDDDVRSLVDLLEDEEKSNLPLVIFPDGLRLRKPTLADLAGNVGLKTRAAETFYDLAIVGGGPAGLAAAVYGASEGLRTVMIEREAPGGQAGMSSRIEKLSRVSQWFERGDLARRAVVQARRFGVESYRLRPLRYALTVNIVFSNWQTEVR